MGAHALWSAVFWTLKGLLCTGRFFWVNPYCILKSTPWITHNSKNECWTPENQITEETPQRIHEKYHRHEHTSTLHKRLIKAERDIQDMKAQLASQRTSWELRFVELQKRQHDLRDQLHSETVVRSSTLQTAADSAEMTKSFTESDLENGHDLEKMAYYYSSELRQIYKHRGLNEEHSNSLRSSQGSFSFSAHSRRPMSAMSFSTSVGSRKTVTGPHRAFVPHSPMDLQIGHRVKILLPSGRISTGTLHYLGQLHGSSDFHLGVELDMPDNGSQTGTYQGQKYFECNTGHGAFVAFSKLLMTWE